MSQFVSQKYPVGGNIDHSNLMSEADQMLSPAFGRDIIARGRARPDRCSDDDVSHGLSLS